MGTWNGPVVRKGDSGWSQDGSSGGHVSGETWEGGPVVMSQSGGYAVQQGSMVATGMGQPVYIAQPAVTPVMMQGSVRQDGGRYTMTTGTVRRF